MDVFGLWAWTGTQILAHFSSWSFWLLIWNLYHGISKSVPNYTQGIMLPNSTYCGECHVQKKKVLRGWDVTSGMCEKSYYSRKQTKNEEPLDSIWLANIATLICSWKYLKNYNILKENHIWDSMHVCITEDSQKKGHWN